MKVLHLVGSPTSEFFADLSRLYAADCLDALSGDHRWQSHIAYVGPDRQWSFPDSLEADALASAPSMPLGEALVVLARLAADIAVPQMFCLEGMTTYRALLDAAAIPYVGNRPVTMAIGADKPRAKAIVAAAGVPVPDAVIVARGESIDPGSVEYPVVVKPADADNSDGITLVRTPEELADALRQACNHSPHALVEQYIRLGREMRCGVLETADGLRCLPLEEYAVDEATKPVRDRGDKLARPDGRLTLVAKTASHAWIVPADDPVNAAVFAAAQTAHRALGCRHYSLFDFRIDPDGQPWFLEAGLYCSYARTSVIATMAAAAGTGVQNLFAAGVASALGGTAA